MRARVSDCTRSTPASAVRPVVTASRILCSPALVVGEHAIGFEHVAMLAAVDDVAMFDQPVEIGAQGGDRGVEPLDFARHVVGNDIGDDDARLVQHDMAERDAVGQRRAFHMHGVARGRFGAGLGERRQFAGGDHLGEHHRRGLQRFFFFFGIGPARAVLHRQARRAYCRRAGSARRGRSGRFLRRFPGGTR